MRLAFDVTAEDRLQGKPHKEVTAHFIPQWRDVPYYKGAPKDTVQKTDRGLRLWQGDSREYLMDAIASGRRYPQLWRREKILAISQRGFSNALDWQEALLQKVLWVEGFVAHVKRLRERIRLVVDL